VTICGKDHLEQGYYLHKCPPAADDWIVDETGLLPTLVISNPFNHSIIIYPTISPSCSIKLTISIPSPALQCVETADKRIVT
jgi:hypothetical protein